jgi:hypothetical protein
MSSNDLHGVAQVWPGRRCVRKSGTSCAVHQIRAKPEIFFPNAHWIAINDVSLSCLSDVMCARPWFHPPLILRFYVYVCLVVPFFSLTSPLTLLLPPIYSFLYLPRLPALVWSYARISHYSTELLEFNPIGVMSRLSIWL